MLHTHRRGSRAAIVLSVGIVALSQAAGAQETRKPFNIAAGPAATAITEFARQAGINVLASGDTLAGIETPAVRGTFSVAEALEKLLFGTRLSSKVASSGSIFITLTVPKQARRASCCAAPRAPARPSEPRTVPANDEGEAVIVTGVMASTKAKAANVSYSVLGSEDIARFTPMSADDMLGDMPGVVVESNDGVARNEVYTRGMAVGSGGPSSGYFWSSILEDGLPVLPVKFSGFQDGGFYRTDISTSKVESVRGGSTGTSVASSVGGVFNFLSRVRPGASIQTRVGFEGTDYHLSWKQVDGYYGKLNEEGDAGYRLSGFYRTANGAPNPGYPLNEGGQVKAMVFKSYRAGGASGTVDVTLKHLDDDNAALTNNFVPTYGYGNPDIAPGFGRNVDLFMHGGQHEVPVDALGNTRHHDPQMGYTYKQDALWLRWDHATGSRWSFNGALKGQHSREIGQQSQWKGLYSLWNTNTFQDQFNVNQGGAAAATANLNRLPGYYELYDLNTGAPRARIYNNVGISQGSNYRTGAACPAGSAASPAQCVSYSELPMPTYDLRGGLVNGIQVPAGSDSYDQDVLLASRAELTRRASRDLMLNVQAKYTGEQLSVNAGLFAVKVRQAYLSVGSGFSLAPFADHGVSNLGARFVTSNGSYQLTDSGGWGRLGAGFGSFRYYNDERDISPYFGAEWHPAGAWDINGSYKATNVHVKTYTENWTQNRAMSGPASRTNGGLDGDPLTWYDNGYFVPPGGAGIGTDKRVTLKNYSGSVGYNFNRKYKLYYRYAKSANNINGAITRYQTAASIRNNPLIPQAELVQSELAYVFSASGVNGQLTYFSTQSQFPFVNEGRNMDGTPYLTEEIRNRYRTQGVEAWARWNITPRLEWRPALTFATGKALAETKVGFGAPGPQDDVLTTTSGELPKVARWSSSNTLTYKLDNLWFNLRHRWMSPRKMVADPADRRYFPKHDNVDLSIQYLGIRDTRVALEVRNLTNNTYISAYDTMLQTVAGVSKNDIYLQLPNSASWIKANASRSMWLTVTHDF